MNELLFSEDSEEEVEWVWARKDEEAPGPFSDPRRSRTTPACILGRSSMAEGVPRLYQSNVVVFIREGACGPPAVTVALFRSNAALTAGPPG